MPLAKHRVCQQSECAELLCNWAHRYYTEFWLRYYSSPHVDVRLFVNLIQTQLLIKRLGMAQEGELLELKEKLEVALCG
ncbi:MAG: hypothetical protein IKN72_12765 [Clostridia bacterium]|nr:hypothetical protein [Clostridia bacterium]